MHRLVVVMATLLIALLPGRAAALNSLAPLSDALGTTWEECERITVQICGTWSRAGESSTWNARWANGAVATLTITSDGLNVTVTRNDQAGPSRGLQATYRGRLSDDGTQVLDGRVDMCCDGFGNRSGTWSATVSGVQVDPASAQAAAPEPEPSPLGDCLGQEEASEVMRARLLATQTAREVAQAFRAELQATYQDDLESTFWDQTFDVAFLSTGPAAALEEAMFAEVEKTLTVKLLEAGANSLLQNAVKTFGSPAETLRHVSTVALDKGLPSEVAQSAIKEGLEALFGKAIAQTIFGVYEYGKFELGVYEGWNGLDAARDLDAKLGIYLNGLDRQFEEQLEIRDFAGFVTSACQDRLARGLPADSGISTFQWNRVQAYLLIEHPD